MVKGTRRRRTLVAGNTADLQRIEGLASDRRHRAPGLWPLITGAGAPRGREDPAARRELARRLAEHVSPAMAAHLLEGATAGGEPLIDPEEARRSRLFNRFHRLTGIKWAMVIAKAGIEVVWLKGLATTHAVYPDPDLRAMLDADLLVRAEGRDRLIAILGERGFSFYVDPNPPPWGFTGDASYLPFLSADRTANIDIHVHPDDYPIHLSLTTERVFAASRTLDTGHGVIRVPSLEHMLLLQASNASRERFQSFTVKSLIDAMTILGRFGETLDWAAIEDLARRGRMLRPLGVFFALLGRLGVALDCVPAHLVAAPAGLARLEFERMIADYGGMFASEPGMIAKLRREFLLGAEPGVAMRRNAARLRGLVRPKSGVPHA